MTRTPGDLFVRLAVLANLAAIAALSSAYAFSQRLFGTGDEAAHLDYAYQVSHGRLPVFEHGLQIEPPWGFVPPVQWTAQHPPLFYTLQAPVVGPFLDDGHYLAAGYAARGLNVLIAVAAVAAIMWAVRAIAPGRTALWLAAGTVAATSPMIIAIGGMVYHDDLVVAECALLIGLTARIVRCGPTARRIAVFSLIAAASLMTRSAMIVPVAICGTTLGLLLLGGRRWRPFLGLTVGGLATLAICWPFYARNVQLTGNLLGSHPDYLKNRRSHTLLEVITDPSIWRQWHLIWGYEVVSAALLASLLVGLPLAVAAVLGGRRLRSDRQRPDLVIGAVLVAFVVLVLAMQTQYVAQKGGASWRYLMPIAPVVCAGVASALTASRRLFPALLSVWVGLAAIPLAIEVGRALTSRHPYSTAPLFPEAAVVAIGLGGAALAVTITVQAMAQRAASR